MVTKSWDDPSITWRIETLDLEGFKLPISNATPGPQEYGLTFPQTNIAPGNGWLEYYLPFGMAYSIFGCYVSFREGISSIKMYQTTTFLVSKWKCIQKWDILPETNRHSTWKWGPLEKGIPIGNHHFDVLCLFWGVYGIIQGQWWLIIFDHTLPPIIMVQSKIGVSPSRFTLPWMFLKIGVPQNGWLEWKTHFEWMMWGYHYFSETPIWEKEW